MSYPAVIAWCLYGLAFAMNMTSDHFPVWMGAPLGSVRCHLSMGVLFACALVG